LNNDYLKKFDYGVFTQRQLQIIGTQASSIIRGTTCKQSKRKYTLRQLMKEGKDTSRLQQIIDKTIISIPEFEMIEPQIDQRIFDIWHDNRHFDGFIQLRLFKGIIIRVPFKKWERYHRFDNQGKLLNSIRIGKDYISLSFEIPDVPKKKEGIKVGADQGSITTLTMSDGQVTVKNKDGHDLYSIMQILQRRKYGSKGFEEAQEHRLNYINWCLNNLDFSLIKEINLEKLFQMRKGRNTSKFLSTFTYTLIKEKLVSLSESEGFTITEVDNQFRSQRCCICGWVQKSNRNGKWFLCRSCGFAADSDLNASMNLLDDRLPPVAKWLREEKRNLEGFFWNPDGFLDLSGEPIVPRTQKWIQ